MKNLALFFTYNTSIADWVNNGSFDRERKIYASLLTEFKCIYFITYGNYDHQYQSRLPAGITILPKKYKAFPSWLYSILLPLFYSKEIRTCTWLKTNQVLGSWSAVIAKVFFRKKLLVRSGYTASQFARHQKNTALHRLLLGLIERLAFTSATHIAVTTPHDRDYLIKRYAVPPTVISILPNSINTKLFRPAPGTLRPPMPFRLLFVGRLTQQKNIASLLTALIGLPDIELTVIGNGPLRPAILSWQKTYHSAVKLWPAIPNDQLPTFYNQAHIYIQPSLYEGNPKTILEAMSCELPVIASRVPGIAPLIAHGHNGYLCETSSSSIRAAIITLKEDGRLRKKLGRNARTFVTTHHDVKQLIPLEQHIYQQH